MLALRDKFGNAYAQTSNDGSPIKVESRRATSQTGAVVVEVLDMEFGRVNNKLRIVSADVKLPSGKKIHVEFTNPPTTGMFSVYDKIRIRQRGNKWEFIEHIP